jgi:hypothetical protein
MKKALLTLAALAMASSAYAQGTIAFFNNNLTGPNGTYRAGIFRDNGDGIVGNSTIGAGAGFTVGLFLASNLTTPLATTTFRTTTAQEVFFENKEVAVPGVQPGQTASFVVRAWDGASFDAATTQRGEQAFTSRALGGPNPQPGELPFTSPDMGPGFTGFEMRPVPEPSTIALGAIGIGALLLRRRK